MKALARMSLFTNRAAKSAKEPKAAKSSKKKLTRRASLAIRPPMGGMARPIKFYLLDGHTVMVHVSNTTTASEACVRIRKQLKLQNDLDFSVFDWTKDGMTLLEDDAVLGPKIEEWAKEAAAASSTSKASADDVPTHRLLYRRRIYVPVGAFAAEVDKAGTDGEEGMAALRLEFKEAQYNTLQGNYPVDEPTAMRLMALVVRMELGAWASDKVAKNEVRDMLDAHVPPLIMKGKNKKAKTKMEGYVVAQWKQHASKTEAALMRLYVDTLKEQFPFYYGSFFFKATCNRPITDKLRTINVGVGFNGISLFITRRGVLAPVEEYKYEDVLQWSVLKEGAMFAFWVNDNDVVALNTPQAVQIDTLVQMYVAENINQLENGTTTTPRMRGAPKPVDGEDSGAAAGAGSGAGAGAATAAAPAAQPRRPPGPPPKKSPGSAGASALAGAGGFIGQGVVPSRAPEPGSVEDLEQKAADAGWELATDADTLIKYYYNPATKAASWTIPRAGADGVIKGDGKKPEDKPAAPATDLLALAAANVVPPGWVRLTDPTTGKPFFLHYASRRTTEIRPRTSKAPPPAPIRTGPGKGRSRGAKKRVAGLRAMRRRKEALLKKENGAAALAEAAADAAVAAAAPGGDAEVDYGDAYYGAAEDVPETPLAQLWYYIDNEEQEQGPFDSVTMAEWFEQGYFADETYVRRADESEWSVYIERWPGGEGRFDVAAA